MRESNPYLPPMAPVSLAPVPAVSAVERRKLVPVWIRIFGWTFMVLGFVAPLMAAVSAALHMPGTFEILGLRHTGLPFEPMGLAILTLLVALGVSASGLLRGKPWGLRACLATGYGSVAICLGTMAYSAIAGDGAVVRLELLVLAPYLRTLHRIKPLWLASAPTQRATAQPQA